MVFAYVRRTTASYRRGVAVSVAAATFLCILSQHTQQSLECGGTIPLGDIRGRIDHLAADVSRRRLYVAQNKDQHENQTFFHDRAEAERQVRQGLAKGKLSVLLRGEKLKGSFALVRTAQTPKNWAPDQAQRPVRGDHRHHQPESLGALRRRGRDMKIVPAHRIAAAQLVPCRQGRVDAAEGVADAGRDGRAALQSTGLDVGTQARRLSGACFIDARGIKLRSRRELELSGTFPRLVADLRTRPSTA